MTQQIATTVKVDLGIFSTETAEKQPEEQTKGGHHRRYSPDES